MLLLINYFELIKGTSNYLYKSYTYGSLNYTPFLSLIL